MSLENGGPDGTVRNLKASCYGFFKAVKGVSKKSSYVNEFG